MSKKVDYSIEALLKNGGKVTGCMGFPWDPKVHTDPCKFCANFGNYFKLHGKCKHHLVYDKPGFDYDLRYCRICNEFISLI